MLKRALIYVLLLSCLSLSASADVVGFTADGCFIQHHLTDNNDQDIYYISNLEEVEVEKEDYNGDGLTDLAAVTIISATNVGYELFLMTDDNLLVQVMRNSDEPALFNFSYSDDCIISHQKNGMGGILCQITVYRWEETDLYMTARLVCDFVMSSDIQDGIQTTICDLNHVSITVTDYAEPESLIVYQNILPVDDSEAILHALDEAKAFLGLDTEYSF